MNPKMNYAKHLASLLVGLAGLMGWLNSTGKNVYAQYYCTLSCNATVPQTGTAGNQISFTALARTLYCEGQPTFKWNFGDGTTSTAGNIAHSYAAAGTYKWTLDVMVDDAGESVNGTITINPAVTN
ncbi:MAG TPA: PKD domain-containing protein, partial [Blastocatellia bacterium]|nr:PKD domain-containing protein [Blastocatellia bacterium]